MDPVIVQYLGFIVAALIIIWAAIELGKRYSRQKKSGSEALTTWIPLDTARFNEREEHLSTNTGSRTENNPSNPPLRDVWDKEDEEELPEPDMHTRAQQNGHYSQSKKPL